MLLLNNRTTKFRDDATIFVLSAAHENYEDRNSTFRKMRRLVQRNLGFVLQGVEGSISVRSFCKNFGVLHSLPFHEI